jgi:hypothetical protein
MIAMSFKRQASMLMALAVFAYSGADALELGPITAKADTSSNETWITIGYNKDRIASAWVQVKSYEVLNENSFRMNAKFANEKGAQIVGRIDLNCRNKDYYFRPNGIAIQSLAWASIPQGSGIENLAKMYCKRTAAKAEWGYSPETAYLWNAPLPTGDPSNTQGNWVMVFDNDEGEVYYNDKVMIDNGVVTYAQYSRSKKGDRSAASPQDTTSYTWIRSSCKENLGSFFQKLDISVDGFWMPPVAGRPNGSGMAVRNGDCQER